MIISPNHVEPTHLQENTTHHTPANAISFTVSIKAVVYRRVVADLNLAKLEAQTLSPNVHVDPKKEQTIYFKYKRSTRFTITFWETRSIIVVEV